MADLGLPIFPTETLAMTVTTTVWIGVCVVVLCNLRLGWTLSGLVVPGYTPSVLGEIYEYVPTAIELQVSAGIFGIGALLFTAMSRVTSTCCFWSRPTGTRFES